MSKKDFLDEYFKDTTKKCEKVECFLVGKRGIVGHNLFLKHNEKKENFKGAEFVIRVAFPAVCGLKEGREKYVVHIWIDVVIPDPKHSVKEYESRLVCSWLLDLKQLDKNLYKKLIDFLKEEEEND